VCPENKKEQSSLSIKRPIKKLVGGKKRRFGFECIKMFKKNT